MKGRAVPFRDAVSPIRIRHYRERFVVRDQLVDQQLRSLIVDVVVAGAVDDQQIAFQVFRKRDRRRVLVILRVVFRQTEITFGVYRVVITIVRRGATDIPIL